MKIFYLYVSARTEMKQRYDSHEGPDTLLYGLNHLARKHDVSFSDDGFSKNFWWLVCLPFETLLIKLTGYGFKLSQVLTNIVNINKSDCVIGCGSSAGLPLGLLRSFGFFKTTKLVLVNIGLVDSWDKYPIVVKLFYKLIYKNIDSIICFSEAERNIITKKVKIAENKTYFLPLGIDTNFFSAKAKLSGEFILSVGRDKGRDFSLIYELARTLETEKFVVITSHRNVLGLETPSNLKVLFDVDYQVLLEHYKKAKVIVLSLKPVERASGQLVLLEALSMNKPVVATFSPGLLAGYEKLNNLVVSTTSDLFSIQKAVLSVLSGKTKLNKNSTRIIKKNYSSAIMAAGLEKVITNL